MSVDVKPRKINIDQRRVKDALSKDVVSLDCGDTIHEGLALMVENSVSALPVVNSRGICVGILSATDLVSLTRDLHAGISARQIDEFSHQWLLDQISEHDLNRRKVEELMTDVVETVGLETPLAEAARDMINHRVHRLPVVDKDGRLLGILSTMDVMAALVEDSN